MVKIALFRQIFNEIPFRTRLFSALAFSGINCRNTSNSRILPELAELQD